MSWIVTVIASAVLVVGVAIAKMNRRHSWRWGVVPEAVVVSGGGVPRALPIEIGAGGGVPAAISAAAATSMVWGLLTGFVFAPAGLVLCALLMGQQPFAGLLVAAVSLHGFALAMRLGAAASWLFRRETDAVVEVAHASLVHHGLVIATFALTAALLGEQGLGLFAMAAVPSVVGLAQAGQLWAACRAGRRGR